MIGIGPADPRYPRPLLDLAAPPDPLWVDGDARILARRALAVVGTRRMTPYGARIAREIAVWCVDAGFVVVSGLAQGVDSSAHDGALEAGGSTVAVLGAGVARYLAEVRGRRRRLAHGIRERGALLSEFPPDAPPQKWTFAQRDATIAALGVATIVVEAPLGSGALITAVEARKLRRPVYAVPGPIGVAASAGTNALIATGGARALVGRGGLDELLGSSDRRTADDASDVDSRILEALAAAPADPDGLARRMGMNVPALSAHVARLLMRGMVVTAADGRLVRR